MSKKEKQLELLIMQRNQLIDALANTNSTFHKAIFGFFTSLVTILAADITFEMSDTLVLFLLQVVIFLVLFIVMLLLTGNMQRYYIYAIDVYASDVLKVNVLFYQGFTAVKHTIGKWKSYSNMTNALAVLAIILAGWLCIELDICQYIAGRPKCSRIMYIALLSLEFIFLVAVLVFSGLQKRGKGAKIFRRDKSETPCVVDECVAYLKRKNKRFQEAKN